MSYLLSEHRGSFFVPGEGGFGGERGPSAERHPPPDRKPDFEVVDSIGPRQGILFRLTLLPDEAMSSAARTLGDPHVDPDLARQFGWPAPLLHGICTFGYLGRAAVQGALGGDPLRVSAARARFSEPILPGEPITTKLWREDAKLVAIVQDERGKAVLSDAVIELAS